MEEKWNKMSNWIGVVVAASSSPKRKPKKTKIVERKAKAKDSKKN